MKIYKLILLLIVLQSNGGCIGQNADEKINVLIPNRVFSDSTVSRHSTYFKNNPVSIMWNNMSNSHYQGRDIYLHINQSNDSLYIYDATNNKDTRIRLPFKISIPVSGLYFHNYDSIFIFIDRQFVAKMRGLDKEMDDFILMDSSANVKDRFVLDDVPYIYNGQLEPMIYYSSESFGGGILVGEILYISFGLYRPNLSDVSLKERDIKLLCAYNLKNKEVQMLNVELPSQDIGNMYNKGVRTSSFDYFIYNDSTMYISFLYSSSIYKLHLKTNEFECVRKFEDFHFNNIANDTINGTYHAWFYAPKYSKKKNVFIREIKIDGYKNFKAFNISQVFDENMNLIGYNFEDSIWTSFSVDSRGEIVTFKKDDHYLTYRVLDFADEKMFIDEVENRFLEKKNIPQTKNTLIDKSKINYNDRMILYLNDIGLSQPVKLVMISSDVVCGHCIEFLMNELKKNKEEFVVQNIKYLFYGNDVMSMVNIINKYSIESTFYYLDIENKNAVYFYGDEMNGYPMVLYRGNKIETIKTDFSKLEKNFKSFLKR